MNIFLFPEISAIADNTGLRIATIKKETLRA